MAFGLRLGRSLLRERGESSDIASKNILIDVANAFTTSRRIDGSLDQCMANGKA